jgi:hypothetical protein
MKSETFHCILSPMLLGLWFLLPMSQMAGADRELGDIKIIRILPRSTDQIAQIHERSTDAICEVVPPNGPLEITSFTPYLTERDRVEASRGRPALPSSRRHILTVGLEIREGDKGRLPSVSRGTILRYLQSHYVTIQARVQKDPVTSELFLHHRPLAATVTFGKGGLTEDFTEPTLMAVRDFHSLGIYLPNIEPRRPKNLRTLVLTYRNSVVSGSDSSGKTLVKSTYEYLFVRGRETRTPPALELYAFCTSGDRRRLHRLEPWSAPNAPYECSIHANVLFTAYTTLGLIPSKSATRDINYKSEAVFELSALDRFAREQQWKGDALDNLSLTLDAIIDSKVVPLATKMRQ